MQGGDILIFVTVGSQKFQFNRLLEEIDLLVGERKICNEVFAQIGYSDYKPKNYKYKEFLDRDEFQEIIEKSKKIITHGGTGAIIGAVKKGKKVIGVPRLKKFHEHVDDHQLQIISEFRKMEFIYSINEIEELEEAINRVEDIQFKKYKSNNYDIIHEIDKFIENL